MIPCGLPTGAAAAGALTRRVRASQGASSSATIRLKYKGVSMHAKIATGGAASKHAYAPALAQRWADTLY